MAKRNKRNKGLKELQRKRKWAAIHSEFGLISITYADDRSRAVEVFKRNGYYPDGTVVFSMGKGKK